MGAISEGLATLIQLLVYWFWTATVEKLADRYPILVGIPLLLLPVLVMAGIIYLLAR